MQDTVGETEVLGHTATDAGQVFVRSPTVHGELVLVVVTGQRNGHRPDAIHVVIGHRVARTAPAIELTVHVDRVSVRQSVLVHVDAEGHVVNAAAVVGRRSGIVVARRLVVTSSHVVRANASLARVPANRIEHDGLGSGHIEVAVGESTFLDHTGTDRVVARRQVLLVGPVVHLELVAVVLAFRQRHRGRPDAVHVVVGHRVAVAAELVPRAGHIHEAEGGTVVVHVHAEGHLGALERSITTGSTAVEADDVEDFVRTAAVVGAVESAHTVVHTTTAGCEVGRLSTHFGALTVRVGVAVEELVRDAGRTGHEDSGLIHEVSIGVVHQDGSCLPHRVGEATDHVHAVRNQVGHFTHVHAEGDVGRIGIGSAARAFPALGEATRVADRTGAVDGDAAVATAIELLPATEAVLELEFVAARLEIEGDGPASVTIVAHGRSGPSFEGTGNVHAVCCHRDVVGQDRERGGVGRRTTGVAASEAVNRVAVVLARDIEAAVRITGVLAIGRNRLFEAPGRSVQPLVLNVVARHGIEAVGPSAITVVRGDGATRAPALEVARHEYADRVDLLFAHVHRDGHEHAVGRGAGSALAPGIGNVTGSHRPQTVGIAEVVRDRHAVRIQEVVIAVAVQVRAEVQQVLLLTVDEPLVLHVGIGSRREHHLVVAVGIQGGHRTTGGIPVPEGAEEANLRDVGHAAAAHIEGGHEVRASATTSGAGVVARGARVVAHHVEHRGARDDGRTVGEAIDGRGALFATRKLLLSRPSVKGELVLNRVRRNVDGDFVDVVSGVGHGVATTTPAVEAAVEVDDTVRTRVVAHVHLEGDRVSAGTIVDGGRAVVVGCQFVGTAIDIASDDTGLTAVVANHVQDDGGVHNLHATVGESIRRVVVASRADTQLFLSRPSVDGELVFDDPGLERNGRRPNTVGIVVAERVASTTPPVEAAIDVGNVAVDQACLAHVHLERDIIGLGRSGTSAVRAALTEAGADGGVLRDRGQNAVIEVARIRTRQSCQVLLGSPIRIVGRAVQEDVVASSASIHGDRHTVRAVAVIIRHGVGLCTTEHTSSEVHAIRTDFDVRRVHIERHIVHISSGSTTAAGSVSGNRDVVDEERTACTREGTGSDVELDAEDSVAGHTTEIVAEARPVVLVDARVLDVKRVRGAHSREFSLQVNCSTHQRRTCFDVKAQRNIAGASVVHVAIHVLEDVSATCVIHRVGSGHFEGTRFNTRCIPGEAGFRQSSIRNGLPAVHGSRIVKREVHEGRSIVTAGSGVATATVVSTSIIPEVDVVQVDIPARGVGRTIPIELAVELHLNEVLPGHADKIRLSKVHTVPSSRGQRNIDQGLLVATGRCVHWRHLQLTVGACFHPHIQVQVGHAGRIGVGQIRALVVEVGVLQHGVASSRVVLCIHRTTLAPSGVQVGGNGRVGAAIHGNHLGLRERRLCSVVGRPHGIRGTGSILFCARTAEVKALNVENQVRLTEAETAVSEAIAREEVAIRTEQGLLVTSPAIDHVLELVVRIGIEVQDTGVNVVTIRIRQGRGTTTAPPIEGAGDQDGLTSRQVGVAHVDLERHGRLNSNRRARTIRGALGEARVDGGVLGDVAQQAV